MADLELDKKQNVGLPVAATTVPTIPPPVAPAIPTGQVANLAALAMANAPVPKPSASEPHPVVTAFQQWGQKVANAGTLAAAAPNLSTVVPAQTSKFDEVALAGKG